MRFIISLSIVLIGFNATKIRRIKQALDISYGACPSPPEKIETRVSEMSFPALQKEIYRVPKVTKSKSHIVLSIHVTEIISINFVVHYWPLLKKWRGPKTFSPPPPTKKVHNMVHKWSIICVHVLIYGFSCLTHRLLNYLKVYFNVAYPPHITSILLQLNFQ